MTLSAFQCSFSFVGTAQKIVTLISTLQITCLSRPVSTYIWNDRKLDYLLYKFDNGRIIIITITNGLEYFCLQDLQCHLVPRMKGLGEDGHY